MPKVTFVYDNLTVDVPAGTPLQRVVEDSGATLPFSCRHGSCGTCRCMIVEGMDNLNPMTEIEHILFDCLTAVEKNERLGCQLIIQGPGDVKIKV